MFTKDLDGKYRISLNSMRVHYYFPIALSAPTIKRHSLTRGYTIFNRYTISSHFDYKMRITLENLFHVSIARKPEKLEVESMSEFS